jgi:hypothetical protein
MHVTDASRSHISIDGHIHDRNRGSRFRLGTTPTLTPHGRKCAQAHDESRSTRRSFLGRPMHRWPIDISTFRWVQLSFPHSRYPQVDICSTNLDRIADAWTPHRIQPLSADPALRVPRPAPHERPLLVSRYPVARSCSGASSRTRLVTTARMHSSLFPPPSWPRLTPDPNATQNHTLTFIGSLASVIARAMSIAPSAFEPLQNRPHSMRLQLNA